MKFYLPTKEECDNICENSEAFYKAERVVEGQNVVIYDYRLASIGDFVDNNAFELRGISFVELEDGTWKRNILMNKFFNLNQTKSPDFIRITEGKNIWFEGFETDEEALKYLGKPGMKVEILEKGDSWMYKDLKDNKIKSIAEKCDGSIISPVKFSNGKIRMKSKMSFESEQAVMAQEFLETHPILLEEIDKLLTSGLTPIFEGIGYENQIVLEYTEKFALRLLQIRREDGTYIPANELKNYSIPMCIKQAKVYDLELLEKICANNSIERLTHLIGNRKFQGLQEMIKFFENTYTTGKCSVLDLLILAKEYVENEEGEVVTFEDGQMAKIKQNWYLSLHGLIGPDAFRENLLIKTIINGTIDDVISALVPGLKKDKIVELDKKVTHKFNHLVVEFKMLRGAYYNIFNENRKEFAIKNRNNPLFGSVMKNLNGKLSEVEQIAEKVVKEYILNKTKNLGNAKKWIEEL